MCREITQETTSGRILFSRDEFSSKHLFFKKSLISKIAPPPQTSSSLKILHPCLKVLRGEETGVGTGKTLRSGPNDNVFVYYSGHGDKGFLCIDKVEDHCHRPASDHLRADDLNNAIMHLHDKKKYKHMLFYIEACFAGSIFEVGAFNLREHLNFYFIVFHLCDPHTSLKVF